MKISAKKRAITAAVSMSEDDLKLALEEALDSDMCGEIVAAAYGYDDYFIDDYFDDMGEFISINFDNMDPLEVAQRFWDGSDLDADEDHANPYREYARYGSGGYVETTDYPNDIYYNQILDEIIDYIVDNYDSQYDEFPEEVQELIDQYTAYSESEDDEEEEEDTSDEGEE